MTASFIALATTLWIDNSSNMCIIRAQQKASFASTGDSKEGKMLTKSELQAFHVACRETRSHCPDGYAKAYANAGMELCDEAYVRTQCLYILGNMSHWRGELARQCRETFRALSKEKKKKKK